MSQERTFNRYYSKKLELLRVEDNSVRGRNNERRALLILGDLVFEGVFVRVKQASKKQNMKRGIDMFGIAELEVDGEVLEVPIAFQIKSSVLYAQECIRQNKLNPKRQLIEVITVNDSRSDEFIKDLIRKRVRIFLASQRDRETESHSEN